MWEAYREVIDKFHPISLEMERNLIHLAQRGSQTSRDELVLRHVGFVIFRLHKRVYSQYLRRYGEDLLSTAIPVLLNKVDTYDLNYCDKSGCRKSVRFASYIWKRIDGMIIDSLKEFLRIEKAENFADLESLASL